MGDRVPVDTYFRITRRAQRSGVVLRTRITLVQLLPEIFVAARVLVTG